MTIDGNEQSTRNQSSELESIKGIGPTFARALHSLGVTQVADLLRYSPDELAQELAAKAGVRATAERIAADDWIGQARRLADVAIDSSTEMPEGETTYDQQPGWRQRAGFSLFFDYTTGEADEARWQTRVYHDESGEEAQFAGAGATGWINWVLERAGLPTVEQEQIATAATASDALYEQETEWRPTDALLDILEVRVAGVDLTPEEPGQLVAEIYFQIVGTEAEALSAARTPYEVEVRAIDAETGRQALVESLRGELEPDALTETVRLQLPVPDLGRYELHSVMHLLPPAGLSAFYEGPALKVVP